MALSEHEHAVLNTIEAGFAAVHAGPEAASKSGAVRAHRAVALFFALLTAGAASVALGLGLQDALGTALGVIGFVLIVAGCATMSPIVRVLRLRVTTRIRATQRSIL